jgi:hypothetical protein
MPYSVVPKDGKFCVINTDTQDEKACHDTKEEAEQQVKLLHAIEKEDD